MAKRFTDSEMWRKQRWFKQLSPVDKLIFLYLKDSCDHAGFYEIDIVNLCDEIGIESLDLHKFIKTINKDCDPFTGKEIQKERLKIVDGKYLWLTGFVKFQYENKEGIVNPNAPVVKGAIALLKKHGVLVQSIDKGFLTLINPNELLKTIKDKDIDKDKEYIKTINILEPCVQIAAEYIPKIDKTFKKQDFEKNEHSGDELKIIEIIRDKLLKNLDLDTVRAGFMALIRDGTSSVNDALNLQFNGHNISIKFRDLANGGKNKRVVL